MNKFARVVSFLACLLSLLTLASCFKQDASETLSVKETEKASNTQIIESKQDDDIYKLGQLKFELKHELVYYPCDQYVVNLEIKFPKWRMRNNKTGKNEEFAYLSFHAGRIGKKIKPGETRVEPRATDVYGGPNLGFDYRSIRQLPDPSLYPIKLDEGYFPDQVKLSLSSHNDVFLEEHARIVIAEGREKGNDIQFAIGLHDHRGNMKQLMLYYLLDDDKTYAACKTK